MQNTTINEVIYPFLLKNIGDTVGKIADNQHDTNKILGEICTAIQGIDVESVLKHDILNGAGIKRRLQRIKIMIGQKSAPNWYDDIIKEWERCVRDCLSMTRKELLCSVDRRGNKSVFDVMDEIPEFRKIGVDILVALERKYKIPPAPYSVEQVRKIGALRREFDHNIVRCMNNSEFPLWVSDRCMETDIMFKNYGEVNYNFVGHLPYQLYWMFAKRHSDIIPEQQIKYLTPQELVNMINRMINDKVEPFRGCRAKFYPMSDQKHDIKLFRDSFIDIAMRVLIA